MSSLIVECVEADVVKHPDADKLCLAKIRGKGWQCVINHQDWGVVPGDVIKAVYFPIDSILPESMVETHSLGNYTHKGRIRTVRLRGEISQGLLLPIGRDIPDYEVGTVVTEELGIQKYEQPIPVELDGEVEELPEGWQRYTEIENIKNFPNVFSDNEEVVVLEKLHGANLSVYKKDGKLYVAGRNYCWKESESNSYWRAIQPYKDTLLQILEDGWQLYGELLGVQDLKYGCEKGNVGVRFFDLTKLGIYQDYEEFRSFSETNSLPTVPELGTITYNYEELQKFSTGDTLVTGSHIREGVVIRPLTENFNSNVGRKILKFISDDYLVRDGKKTEYN